MRAFDGGGSDLRICLSQQPHMMASRCIAHIILQGALQLVDAAGVPSEIFRSHNSSVSSRSGA